MVGSRARFCRVDTGPELDLARGVEDSNDGKYWSIDRRDNRGASGVSYFLLLPYPTPDISGGSVLSVGDRYHQGGPVRNPSRMFLLLAVFSRPTSGSGGHLPNNPSRDQLAHYNQSRTSFQGTHRDRNASRRDVDGRGSRGSTTRGLVFVIADTGIESDLHGDLDDNDEGKYRSGDRRNNRGPPRMLPALIPP